MGRAKGITWDKSTGKWLVRVTFMGHLYFIGRFRLYREAKAAHIGAKRLIEVLS